MSTQPSAAETAYTHTKTKIIRGELAGGQLLSEAHIGTDLGISRTPVHEAFLRLAAERLITLSSRRGAVVVPMNPRESSDVLEMREAIEGSAASALTAGPISGQLARRLDDLLADQRQCAESGDVDGFAAADDAFHTAIVEASGNAIAVHFFALLRDRQQRVRHQLFAVEPAQLPKSLDDHTALRDAALSGSAAEYRRILHQHIARTQGVL